jgi:hypothetical protein
MVLFYDYSKECQGVRETRLILLTILIVAQDFPDNLVENPISAYHFLTKNAKMGITRKLKIRGQKCYK